MSTPPSPSPPAPEDRPAEPGGGPASHLTEAARARECDRLLTLANVQRMRGQLPEAKETLKKALALGQSRVDAQIHEMLGDVLAADERWEEAKTAFGTAHALDPERVSSERKFAQMTLRVADATNERALAEAMLRGEMPQSGGAGAFGGGPRGKRSPGLALLLSTLVPGFGQFYNGQLVKGLICLGTFFVTLIAVRLSPDSGLLIHPVRGAHGQASPLLWLLVLLSAVIWLYSVLDASMTASRTSEPDAGPDGSEGDKSGWEV